MSQNPYAAPRDIVEQVDDARLRRGRILVLLVIGGMLGTSFVVIALFVISRGAERLPFQILRFSITALVCFFLYRGVPAARWLTVIFCVLGGLGSLASASIPLLPLAAIYLTLGGILAFSRSVSAFLCAQREPARAG